MSNTQLTTKQFFQREDVKSKFTELLGTRTNQFMTSLLSIVNNNSYLKNASPESIYTSAMMAAALDLPINPNLSFAYLVPYGSACQFQLGWRGYVQLALRTGQFKTVSPASFRTAAPRQHWWHCSRPGKSVVTGRSISLGSLVLKSTAFIRQARHTARSIKPCESQDSELTTWLK